MIMRDLKIGGGEDFDCRIFNHMPVKSLKRSMAAMLCESRNSLRKEPRQKAVEARGHANFWAALKF